MSNASRPANPVFRSCQVVEVMYCCTAECITSTVTLTHFGTVASSHCQLSWPRNHKDTVIMAAYTLAMRLTRGR